jgi:antitoxin ParD1/3/4
MLPKFGNFGKNRIMGRNTSVAIGGHFEQFISKVLTAGRYGSASEVI